MKKKYIPNEIDRQKVSKLCALGTPQTQIGIAIGVTPPTLRKHYRKELTEASIEANAKVAETLFNMATSGKYPAATIFWAKTRNRFTTSTQEESPSLPKPSEPKPPSTIVVLNNDGGPIELD